MKSINKFLVVMLCFVLFTTMAFALSACTEKVLKIAKIEVSGPSETAVGEFDYNDYTVKVIFDDGSTNDIKLNKDLLSASDRELLDTPGTHTITVKYNDVTCTFTVTIKGDGESQDKGIKSIAISGPNEIVAGNIDYNDFSLVITYEDDSTTTIELREEFILEEDRAKLNTVGSHSISITYNGTTTIWNITVKENESTGDIIFEGVTFEDATYTYDGREKSIEVNGVPNGATVKYNVSNSYTNAGVYPIEATISKEGYKTLVLTATLTINKATYDMSGVEFEDKTVVYNGEVQRIEISGSLPQGVTVSYDNNENINVGTYEVVAKFTGDSNNYETIADMTATLTINKATYDMSSVKFVDKTVVYNGEVQRIEISGSLPQGVTVTYENNDKTDVGTYEVVAKFTGDSNNYETIADMTATLTIIESDFEGVTFKDATYIYDGREKSVEVNGVPDGATVKYNVSNSYTNAGIYPIEATISKEGYKTLVLTATLTINKATYDMSGVEFADKTVVYNEEVQRIEISGNLPQGVTVSYDNNENINVGTYEVVAKFTGDSDNYNVISDKTAQLIINKATYDMSGVEFDDKTVVYNGEVQKIEISGSLPQGVTVTYENNDKTDVGTYEVIAKFTGDSNNYETIADMTATLTINKATYDMSGVEFEGKTVVYNGEVQRIEISGNLPQGVTVTYENNDNTDVGTYKVIAKFTGDSNNYETIADMTATLTINKATYDMSGVEFVDKTFSYDGTEKELIISGSLPNGVTVSYINNKLTEAGTITATAIFTGDSNNYEPISDKTAILTVVRDGLYYKVIFVLSETEKVQVVVKNNEGVIDSDIPTIPDRLGYDGAWDKDFSCVTEDIEVYINYTPIEYSITYVCGSFGTNNADNPTTYTIESPVITLENAITDAIGTIFDGWYTTPNYEEETKVTSLETGHYGDLILYAKWIRYCVEQAEGFDIDYSLENYELPAIVAVVENAKTLMTLSSMIKVSDGCTWELSRDIEGTEIIKTKNVSLNTGHNIYYITVWYGDTYSLAYIVDIYRLDNVAYSFVSDDSVFVDEAYAEETTFIDKPETDPQKTGHTFIGWSVNGEVVDFPYELRYDTVFTAEYEANTYTISYLFDDEVVYQEMVKFGSTYTLYEYNTADYEIVAWMLDGSELSPNTQTTLTVDHDIVYTAKIAYLSNEFTYSINDNNATITGYNGAETSIVIPDYIKIDSTYYTVTSIGEGAFSGYNSLTSVTIPASVTSIGSNAFSHCSGLISVKIPFVGEKADGTGVTHFGFIFGASSYTDNSSYVPESLREVIITGGTKIGSYAFYNCSGLTSITIPNSVINIESYAFWCCSGLTDVYYAGDIAGWCNIQFGSGNSNPMYYADNLHINGELLQGELIIPDSVKSIRDYAFYNCSGLASITIPDSVTSIGVCAFEGCTGLTSVTIGNGVTSIGNLAFYNCSGLTSVKIPDSVISIGTWAFTYCSGLTSITIPDSVTSIGEIAFSGCSGLTDIYYAGDIAGWCNIQFDSSTSNPMYYADNLYINGELVTDLVIPNSVTSIEKYAFYNCSGLTSITIPDSVTSIGNSAFSGCSGLTSVTIGNGVTSIGNYTFGNCSGLESITFGENSQLESIGSNAFDGCSSLTSITIPDSVTSIGDRAFYGCSGLTSITIPYVGEKADGTGATHFGFIFGASSNTDNSSYVPESLREATITGGTIIGEDAFYGCTGLASITIPGSVISIGDSAFDDCSGLTDVYYTGDIAEWCNIQFDGGISNPMYYADNLYINGDLVTDLVIPDSATSIGSYAFYNCRGLTSVKIPDSVTSIGSSAFEGCTGLTSVTIGNGVTSIGNLAFYNCRGLTSVKISDSVISIGDRAFYNCSGLTSVKIPDSVTSIGERAFAYCSGLESITFSENSQLESIGSNAFYGCSSLTSITIPDSVTSIGGDAFYNCSLLTIYCEVSSKPDGWDNDWNYRNYPVVWDCNNNEIAEDGYIYAIIDGIKYGLKDGEAYIAKQSRAISGELVIADKVSYKGNEYIVTSIGYSAFLGCTGLTSVTIGNGVTNIGDSAFDSCTGLTSVTIGNGVTSIGGGAFYGCTGLTSITIPDSVTSIGGGAFSRCTGLTSITIPDSVTSIGDRAFYNCSGLTSITIPDSVTSIGYSAFYGCSGLTSITIPDSVTSIGHQAFYGCSGLTSITIPDSVTSIGSSAFSGCSGLTSINVAEKNSKYYSKNNCLIETDSKILIAGCKTSVIPYSVTIIWSGAFYNCTGLARVTIPSSVTSIGDEAFYGCSGLTSITIPYSVTSIGDEAFYGCSGLTSITIPYSVTSIGDEAFYNCSGLTSITIPDSVTSIGYRAFYGCSGLTSITIPDSVTSIGAEAFWGCSGLTSITIPDSVTSIGYRAFSGCSNLTNVTFNNTQGWWYSSSSSATSGTSIPSFYLANSSTAATYLTSTYYNYYWKRS